MFGYVKPYKPQMKICEYEIYKAAYCGLCKQLGRQYGPFSRLTLSYDFAFLSLLALSQQQDAIQPSSGRCMLNPVRRSLCFPQCEQMDFSAGVAMLMFYYKALDNYNDGNFGEKCISTLFLPIARRAMQKAADAYPQAARIIYEAISRQNEIETQRCDSVDQAAEPTALALSGICGLLSQDSGRQRVLSRFGYLLGRYVYLCDALDDLEEDIRRNNYNPFILREKLTGTQPQQLAAIRENAKGSLLLTIGELIKTYELLDTHHYQPILDNIVHLGLRDTVERILLPKETERK